MDRNWKELLFQSVQEHSDIVQGKRRASRTLKATPGDISALRHATGLSQDSFAKLLEVKVGTLRNWEQGRRAPTGPARALLKVLKARPAEVIRALAEP